VKMDEGIARPLHAVDREKTAPFLIRTFVKIGGFHRPAVFEEGSIPTADELQIFTWKDATLKEVLTTLRCTAPASLEYRHPLARYSFKALFADPTQKGAFTTKDLGMVYSRDILGEPGSLVANTGEDGKPLDPTPEEEEKARLEKTLEDLRFVPGDYLLMGIMLPKTLPPAATGGASGLAIKGSSGLGTNGAPSGKWARGTDAGWNAPPSQAPGFGRGGGGGGGHWRGRPGGAPPTGRGDKDLRPPLPRRDSPPPVRDRDRIRGDRDRDRDRPRERERDRFARDRRSRSPPRRSRSRSPLRRSRSPPPRRRRYD